MKTNRPRNLTLLLIVVAALLLYMTGSGPSLAQQDGTGKDREKCDCENLTSSVCAPAYQPPVPPKKKPPLPPIKSRVPKNVYVGKLPPINDPELPGVDAGTGTAANTESNYRKGLDNNREHRNPDGTMSRSGFYPERRRYVYNSYKFAQGQVGLDKGITQEQFETVKAVLKRDLEEINSQEREAYYEENKVEFGEQLKDLNTNVDAQNELRTNAIIAEIDEMNIERFDELEAALDQVIGENISQARAQQMLGADGSRAEERARKILDKLYNKFAKDCGKSTVATNLIIRLERTAQTNGIANAGRLDACVSVTAVAKIEVAGIAYEAKKCLGVSDQLPGRGVTRFEGNWFITISGMMTGSGSANVMLGSGDWQSNAEVAGGTITQDGPAELVSGGGQCALKIRATNAVAMIEGHRVRMSGIGGQMPIKILNQTCNTK